MKHAAFLLYLFLFAAVYPKGQAPAKAPLPKQILQAHSIFLVNGGGSDGAYDALYEGIKNWGRYQIVGSPDQADITFTIQAWVQKSHGDVLAIPDKRTGNTIYIDTDDRDPQFKITISDPRTQMDLWSTILHRKLVFRSKVGKETRKTIDAYIEDLKSRSQ